MDSAVLRAFRAAGVEDAAVLRPRPRWSQIVAEMVTDGADRGHLEQIESEAEQIEAEAEQIVAEMVTDEAR